MANKIILIAGQRNSGKTNSGKALINAYYDAHGETNRILIVDTVDHEQYRHVQAIEPHFIKAWKSKTGVYRCFSSPPPGADTDWHLQIVTGKDESGILYFNNGLFVIEDATKLTEDRLQPYLRNFLADTKQFNVDVIFMFHGFGFVPRRLWKLADVVVIHKTVENFNQIKGNIPAPGLIEPAFITVQNHPNRYYSQTVKLT
ncbi:MAG: hypothetical protein PHV07_02985 [Oscillospiraceae bacterium]|nr:hypothetical protein [Oscillospiraceae bacterium]